MWCPSYRLRTPLHTHGVAYEILNTVPFFCRRCSANSPTSTSKATTSPTPEHFVCERGNQGAENYIGILRTASRNFVPTADNVLGCARAGVEITTVWHGKHPDGVRTSSDQDVPASEIARESPENDTTCEYHGLLQAAGDTNQLLFVAFEGRCIHVQQLLNIVVNSDM